MYRGFEGFWFGRGLFVQSVEIVVFPLRVSLASLNEQIECWVPRFGFQLPRFENNRPMDMKALPEDGRRSHICLDVISFAHTGC